MVNEIVSERERERERDQFREFGTPGRGTAVFEIAPMCERERKNPFVSKRSAASPRTFHLHGADKGPMHLG